MKIEAKALLLNHAAEQLDAKASAPWPPAPAPTPAPPPAEGPYRVDDEDVAHARAANLGDAVLARYESAALHAAAAAAWAGVGAASETFAPGPPRPAPPPQQWPYARIVQRSIAGDDEDATPRLPSLGGFLAAAAASHDWGVPVKSGAKWMAEKEGPSFTTRTPSHDPCTGREHYALAQRELARIADGLPITYGLTGHEQLAVWASVAGAGVLEERNIHAGAQPDAIDRENAREAKRVRGRRGKRKAEPMQPPAKRRAFLVPERKAITATAAALTLRDLEVYVTPHQVGLVCRTVSGLVQAAFEARGWVRAKTKSDGEAAKESDMAKTGELVGWKAIADCISKSTDACQRYARRTVDPMPVGKRLGEVVADKAAVEAWFSRQTMPLAG